MDEIDANDINTNEIDRNKIEIIKENNEEGPDSNVNNAFNKAKTEHLTDINDVITNDDEDKLNTSKTFAVKGNNDNNKDKEEEDTKHKIKGKVTKAIKGIKQIFKHKNKDEEEEEKEKKEENENDAGESKFSKTKHYLSKLKHKFIKGKDNSEDNDKKDLNDKEEN